MLIHGEQKKAQCISKYFLEVSCMQFKCHLLSTCKEVLPVWGVAQLFCAQENSRNRYYGATNAFELFFKCH
jgi:hypothetical protein